MLSTRLITWKTWTWAILNCWESTNAWTLISQSSRQILWICYINSKKMKCEIEWKPLKVELSHLIWYSRFLKCQLLDNSCSLIFFTKSKIKDIVYLTLDLRMTDQKEIIAEMHSEMHDLQVCIAKKNRVHWTEAVLLGHESTTSKTAGQSPKNCPRQRTRSQRPGRHKKAYAEPIL